MQSSYLRNMLYNVGHQTQELLTPEGSLAQPVYILVTFWERGKQEWEENMNPSRLKFESG